MMSSPQHSLNPSSCDSLSAILGTKVGNSGVSLSGYDTELSILPVAIIAVIVADIKNNTNSTLSIIFSLSLNL